MFRLHARRKPDFRRGIRLGKGDHIIRWSKPALCPKALDRKLFEKLPEELVIREIRFFVMQKGFRTRNITVVTTLLEPDVYPKEEIARLYGLRWQVELDLRHLKTNMQMEVLRGKTAEMVRKEVWAHLLAYNLIRTLLWESAQTSSNFALQLSFCTALHHFNTFTPLLAMVTGELHQYLYEVLLRTLSHKSLPQRQGRVEPRAKKRRPKPYPWLKQPRQQLRESLAA